MEIHRVVERGWAALLPARARREVQPPARLEVEPCGYAGQFAVNAAKLIGGRAHAIGVVSANSSVTTRVQVRPNGDGNTGYSEITPGDAPELQYLQLLGDLVGEVIAFANLVTEVYLLPDNRELIFTTADHDYDPNPAGWALRMWGEFTINESCMWLFAETCRVILLQQLRSSRTGIEGRRGRFESTLQMFNQKLDILGASVVKMTTLRRALRHANRYGLTGSVRSVLSHEPPPRHYGHGEMIEVPAPIVSVAAGRIACSPLVYLTTSKTAITT